MSDQSLPEKPAAGAPLVPARAKGPRKREGVLPTRRIKGKTLLKQKPMNRGKKRIPSKARTLAPEVGGPGTEQVGRKPVAGPPDKYVRLRLRVENGQMSVVDSHEVEGTLIEPHTIHGNFAYEVIREQRRLYGDSIPDLGVTRSFSDPEGALEQRGHHITELSSYEFNARVPAKELGRAALSKIEIALYRVKERAPEKPLGIAPLSVQFERELREVARLKGIPADKLPPSIQKQQRPRRARTKRKPR